jgi:predicted transcriptional regulator
MAERFGKPTTMRLAPDVAEQVRKIARNERNPESAVLRRALVLGLAVITRDYGTGLRLDEAVPV